MRIGFVRFTGVMGEGIRADQIRRFLLDTGFDVTPIDIGFPRPSTGPVRTLLQPAMLRALASRLAGRQASILNEYRWSMETSITARGAAAAARELAGKLSGVDVLHAEGFLAAVVCARVSTRLGVPFVYDMHGSVAEEARISGARGWMEWCRREEQRVVRAARRVVVVSAETATFVCARYGIPRERIAVAPNGATPTDDRAAFMQPLTVIYAGNLAAFENILVFVRTAARASDRYRFVLVGDGPMRHAVIDEINRSGANVAYLGRKSPDVTRTLLCGAQVGFVGQTGGEVVDVPGYTKHVACPIKAFEYAMCGLPSVFAPGEWAAALRDADAGVEAASTTPEAFVRAIDALADERTWREKADHARVFAREQGTWNRMLGPIRDLYRGFASTDSRADATPGD